MSQYSFLKAYENIKRLNSGRIELVVVEDPYGQEFNSIVEAMRKFVFTEKAEHWESLLKKSKWLRWHLAHAPMLPQSTNSNNLFRCEVESICDESRKLRHFGDGIEILDQIEACLEGFADYVSPIGKILISSIDEIASDDFLVLASSYRAANIINQWLMYLGSRALTPAGARRSNHSAEVVFAVGPPKSFNRNVISAPLGAELTFFMPNWFSDRDLPASDFLEYANFQIDLEVKTFFEPPSLSENFIPVRESQQPMSLEDEVPQSGDAFIPEVRQGGDDMVPARLFHFAGGFHAWLESDSQVRVLGEGYSLRRTIESIDVRNIRSGAVLALKATGAETEELRLRAVEILNEDAEVDAESVVSDQLAWKSALKNLIEKIGSAAVERKFEIAGMKVTRGAERWTHEHFIRPAKDEDFLAALRMLDLDADACMDSANRFRSAHYRAMAAIRKEIEQALDGLNLEPLSNNGYMVVDVGADQISQVLIAEVALTSTSEKLVPASSIGKPRRQGEPLWHV